MSNRINEYQNGRSNGRSTSLDHESQPRPDSLGLEQAAGKQSQYMVAQLKNLIKERPTVAIGTAVTVGLLIGFFVKRR